MNRVEQVEDLHQKAMEYMDSAFAAKRRKDNIESQKIFQKAFELEKKAAELVADDFSFEPTRSVLHRSAATLALDCGEIEEAKHLIEIGLSGNPPEEIAEELKELQKQFRKVAANTGRNDDQSQIFYEETQKCLSFDRSYKLALDMAQATDEERKHIGECKYCRARMVAFEREIESPANVAELNRAELRAKTRQAIAAIVVNLERPELFIPLQGYGVEQILAKAAGEETIDAVERGEIDFIATDRLPAGTTVEVLDVEKVITVVVPCQDEFTTRPPHVELLLENEEILTSDLVKEKRYIRKRAGDPGSIEEKECWVAYFDDVPLKPLIVITGLTH